MAEDPHHQQRLNQSRKDSLTLTSPQDSLSYMHCRCYIANFKISKRLLDATLIAFLMALLGRNFDTASSLLSLSPLGLLLKIRFLNFAFVAKWSLVVRTRDIVKASLI